MVSLAMATMFQTACECHTTSSEAIDGDVIVCRCLSVTESEIQTAISAFNVQTVRELGRCTGAGKGCMACHGRLKALVKAQLG